MSKRFRIDFAIRELDVPADEARGIKFGDDVNVDDIMDFFDRCRNAARALFVPQKKMQTVDKVWDPNQMSTPTRELSDLLKLKKEEHSKMLGENRAISGCITRVPDYSSNYMGDDGSRGGDGPPSDEYMERVAAQKRGRRY